MWISRAKLTNFRNYKDLSLDLANTVYFLVGKNGQGKTNILESIGLASFTKSFREASVADLVRKDTAFFRLTFSVEEAEVKTLESYFGEDETTSNKRAFWKNGVEVALAEYIASLKVVVFSPENINLLLLGPDARRKYLNALLLQNFPKEFSVLGRYSQVLAQRNALLFQIKRGFAQKKELAFWNAELLSSGAKIMALRKKLIENINKDFERFFREIAQTHDEARVVYKPGVEISDEQNIELDFLSALTQNESKDIEKAITHSGPHRDNFEIQVNGSDLLSFGSRGELRTALLAMKFAECTMFGSEKPVLLLDDVFSELDAARRQKVLELSRPYQTFITTCEMADLPQDRTDTKLFKIKNGAVETE